MKTTILFFDDTQAQYPDLLPSIDPDAATLDLIDQESGVVESGIPLGEIKRVTFEP